jgi:DNA-binding NarL/FixJ family response regulator
LEPARPQPSREPAPVPVVPNGRVRRSDAVLMVEMQERLQVLAERAIGLTESLVRLRATQRPRVAAQAGAAPRLSERQIAILRMIADGKDNAEIAHELNFALGTIKLHVREILDTLGCPTRAAAAARAVRLKLI